MLTKLNRFHGYGSLKYLYKNGTSVRSRYATLRYVSNPHRKACRVSVVISKKVHKSAVGRNRIRRRTYELLRHELPEFTGVYDVVVIIVSGETLSLSHQDLRQNLLQLLHQTPVYQR